MKKMALTFIGIIVGIQIILSRKGFATINNDFSKAMDIHTPRNQVKSSKKTNRKNANSNKKKNKKKLRKLYLNFNNQSKEDVSKGNENTNNSDLSPSEQYSQVESYRSGRSNIRIKSQKSLFYASSSAPLGSGGHSNSSLNKKDEIGFTNQFVFGYSNSAFRYQNEEFPAKSIDFVWAPLLTTTCFTLNCIYNVRVLGGFDLNNEAKNEFGLVQLGLRFPGEPWGGYLTPDYGLRFFLPATPKEINDEKMIYGYGAAFSLATTPELLGSDFITLTVALSARKDMHSTSIVPQRNWMGREALLFDFKFTESLFATVLFGHIYSEYYDKSNKDILELIQTFRWKANKWLDLGVTHSNVKPTYLGESYQVDNMLINNDSSIFSLSVGLTNSF